MATAIRTNLGLLGRLSSATLLCALAVSCASSDGPAEPLAVLRLAATTCTRDTLGDACQGPNGEVGRCGLFPNPHDPLIRNWPDCCYEGCLHLGDCMPGGIDAECGWHGQDCHACDPCEECDFDCEPKDPGDACGTCGVCDGNLDCQAVPEGTSCGACSTCSGDDRKCNDVAFGTACSGGSCVAAGECCRGCVDGTGTCRAGTQENYCGSDGASCEACPPCSTCNGGTCVPSLADGTPCSDDDVCTENDACESGHCVGSAVTCADKACATVACDAVDGCVYASPDEPRATACDDGNDCTTVDFCEDDDGDPATLPVCRGTGGVVCNDLNPCTSDQCRADSCPYERVRNGTACDLGNRCIVGQSCQNGECEGEPRNCDDDNPCTMDSCQATGSGAFVNPLTGCKHVPLAASSCDDGDACTDADACNATGACLGVPKPCGEGTCEDGACVFPPEPGEGGAPGASGGDAGQSGAGSAGEGGGSAGDSPRPRPPAPRDSGCAIAAPVERAGYFGSALALGVLASALARRRSRRPQRD